MNKDSDGASVPEQFVIIHQAYLQLDASGESYRMNYYMTMLGQNSARQAARGWVASIHSHALNFKTAWETGWKSLPEVHVDDKNLADAIKATDDALSVCHQARVALSACVSYCRHYRDAQAAMSAEPETLAEAESWSSDVNRVLGSLMADSYVLESRMARLSAYVQLRLSRRLEILTYLVVSFGALAALAAVLH